jgi:cobyrinic acid a,c-diamide synthase
MDEGQILESFITNSTNADVSIIEGNRGLFDGLDLSGNYSTAKLGKLLKTPVVLVVDVTMATRTMAALVMGCQRFDPDLNIVAVILNRVAGPRQDSVVRNSIEQYCEIPVIGSVPKLKGNFFPERHMGLIPYQERNYAEKAISWARSVVKENLDLEILTVDAPRIGFIRDRSFWFYYPENLDQLKNLGAALVEINSITEKKLPDLDALYIGGGFPETQAQALADNQTFRYALREKIEKGLPVYAECGGFMYLGESLLIDGKTYPMVGALPVKFTLQESPQGHGYTVLEVVRANPYYPVGKILRGHEFHYSKAVITNEEDVYFVFKVSRGHGMNGQRDGVCRKNLLATYSHVHAAGNLLWAKSIFRAALDYKKIDKNFYEV